MGPGTTSLTVSGESGVTFRVFDIVAGATVQISGLTIANGSEDQGAGILNNGNLTLTDSLLMNNKTIMNGNKDQGGGIYNSGTLTVSGTTFSGNTGSTGAGDFPSGDGGAIYNDGTCTVTNSLFSANSAGQNGGAIYSDKGLSVSGCQFNGNATQTVSGGLTGGGAICVGGTLKLDDSTFTGNSSYAGGALYVFGTADVGTSAFLSNSGGGIYIGNGGSMTVATNTISANTGSGITNNFGSLTVTDSTLSGNSTTGSGGGIDNNGGTLSMTDCTISGNSAQDGGGIYNTETNFLGVSPSINGCTIAFNSGGNGGGIDLDTTAQVRNTIVADNKGAMGPDIFGTFSSMGYNLIQNPSGAQGFASTDQLSVDPLLGSLQDNGGPTIGAPGNTITLQTCALLPGSRAIGAGDPTNAPPTDQRGLPRLVNGMIDIGAYETQNTGPAVTQLVLGAPPP